MIISKIILAILFSLDAFGIGIFCGLEKSNVLNTSKNTIILFFAYTIMTFITTYLIGLLAFPKIIFVIINSIILMALGLLIICQAWVQNIKNKNNFISKKQNIIKMNEKIYLIIILLTDILSLKLACTNFEINNTFLIFLLNLFQIIFLFFGKMLKNKINFIKNISVDVFMVFFGIVLIISTNIRLCV